MENIIRNDGERLKERMKAKGYDMKTLANRLNISRVSVEKDLAKTVITRRSLVKYVPMLVDDIENFYAESVKKYAIPESSIDSDMALRYKDELLAAKEQIITEQRKHIETLSSMLRFFPNAVQQAIISA